MPTVWAVPQFSGAALFVFIFIIYRKRDNTKNVI